MSNLSDIAVLVQLCCFRCGEIFLSLILTLFPWGTDTVLGGPVGNKNLLEISLLLEKGTDNVSHLNKKSKIFFP